MAPIVLRVHEIGELETSLAAAGIPMDRPALVLVGGAAGLDDDVEGQVYELLARHLVPMVDRVGAVMVTGGTDAGVMRAAGRARETTGASFALVGVVAAGTMDDPGLEPHHTHAVVVPGDCWGDESPWLSQVAKAVAGGRAGSATVLVNGGQITLADAGRSLDAGRQLIVLAGTGRAADDIASAQDSGTTDGPGAEIAASDLTQVLPLSDPEGVIDAVASALGVPPNPRP